MNFRQEKENVEHDLHPHNTHTPLHNPHHKLTTPNLRLTRNLQPRLPPDPLIGRFQQTHSPPRQRPRGLNLHLNINKPLTNTLMLDNWFHPTPVISLAELQCDFKRVAHDANTHGGYERSAGAECAFDDLCAGTRGCEQVSCGNAEVSEACVWTSDGSMAAERGVGEDFICFWGILFDVGACDE
jgi:hypothetical protein